MIFTFSSHSLLLSSLPTIFYPPETLPLLHSLIFMLICYIDFSLLSPAFSLCIHYSHSRCSFYVCHSPVLDSAFPYVLAILYLYIYCQEDSTTFVNLPHGIALIFPAFSLYIAYIAAAVSMCAAELCLIHFSDTF